MKIFKIWASFLAIFLILGAGRMLLAQEGGISLGIAPVRVEAELNRGDSIERKIRVSNKGDQKLRMRAYTENFVPKDEFGEAELTKEADPRIAAATWISFAESEFDLGANSTKEVAFKISVPKEATPGAHWAAMVFEPVTAPQQAVTVSGRIASLVIINVAGEVVESGEISAFKVGFFDSKAKKFYAKGSFKDFPVAFDIYFKNTGTVYYKPKGTIEISRFGKKVAVVNVTEENVLPGSTRQLITSWPGIGWIGKYNAKATLTYGKTGKQAVANLSFYIIPWDKILIILLIILVIVFMIWFFGIRYKNILKKKLLAEIEAQKNLSRAEEKGEDNV